MDSNVLFETEDVVVTKEFARINEVTYPINGIGSVYILKPDRKMLFFGAIVCLLIALSSASAEKRNGESLSIAFGLLSGVLGVTAYRRPYKLMIRTASLDKAVLVDVKRDNLQLIRVAIERAVVLRG